MISATSCCFLILGLIAVTYFLATISDTLYFTVKQDNINIAAGSLLKIPKMEYKNDKWADVLRCQRDRLENIQKQCNKYNIQSRLESFSGDILRNMTYFFLIDDVHQITLRVIPKASSTSWKVLTILNRLRNDTTLMDSPHNWRLITGVYGFKAFLDRDKDYIISTLRNYFAILTVRHPLVRMESAFKDLELYRKKVKHMKDSDIAKMFQARLDAVLVGPILDMHWIPVTEHTNPCAIPFDFIAKTETADMDMKYIVNEKLSGFGGPVHERSNPAGLNSTTPSSDCDIELPLFNLLDHPEKTIKKLISRYYLDMKLFGYSYKVKQGKVVATCDSYAKYKFCC